MCPPGGKFTMVVYTSIDHVLQHKHVVYLRRQYQYVHLGAARLYTQKSLSQSKNQKDYKTVCLSLLWPGIQVCACVLCTHVTSNFLQHTIIIHVPSAGIEPQSCASTPPLTIPPLICGLWAASL